VVSSMHREGTVWVSSMLSALCCNTNQEKILALTSDVVLITGAGKLVMAPRN
jgi:hypothetical protein